MGEDEFFVASDIPAILSHTRDVIFLGDEEMAIITRSGVEFTDYAGGTVSKTTQRVLWDPIAAEKGGHKHFMLKEIFEQPTAARDTILGRVSLDQGQVFLEELNIEADVLRAVEKVTIVACGTSWHAALVGKYMIESLAQVRVEVDYGSEYRYRDPIVGATSSRLSLRSRVRPPTRSQRCARPAGKAPAASRSATSSGAWPHARPTERSTPTPGRRSA